MYTEDISDQITDIGHRWSETERVSVDAGETKTGSRPREETREGRDAGAAETS